MEFRGLPHIKMNPGGIADDHADDEKEQRLLPRGRSAFCASEHQASKYNYSTREGFTAGPAGQLQDTDQ